jgi:hypothetical protein
MLNIRHTFEHNVFEHPNISSVRYFIELAARITFHVAFDVTHCRCIGVR